MYTVIYMSCGVIAHMIRYDDLSRALSDAIYWKHHTKVWVSEILIYKTNVIHKDINAIGYKNILVAALTGGEY